MADTFFEDFILQRQKVVEYFKKKISGKKLILIGRGNLAEQTIRLVGDILLRHQFYYNETTEEFLPCVIDGECCNSLEKLIKESDGRTALLIAQENFFLIKGILEKNFLASNIEVYISLANWAVDIDEHKVEIEHLFSMLEDEFSKKTLQNIFLARLKRCVVSPIVYMKMNALCDQFIGAEGIVDSREIEGFRNSPQTYIEMKGTSILPYADQYFRSGLFTFSEEEVYIDAGAFDGDTVKEFSRLVDYQYKSIYAFEPDVVNFGKLQNDLAALPKVNMNLICAGVSDKEEEIPFEVGKCLSSCFAQNAENFAKSVKIDECIKEKVTFIKMDVEGFEARALLGARRILANDSPKLAICLYHKPADIWEIPLLVKRLNPKYKLYIRHHSIFAYETILYAKV